MEGVSVPDIGETGGGPTVVVVVCDSRKHARGKVAKIDQFIRIDGRWHSRGTLRKRGTPGSGFADDLRCKLCGQSVPRPADAVLNRLAAQGESSATLAKLRSATIH